MSRKRSGREGLLDWLQSRTSGYNNVNVVDFTDSWVNGLAFCALLHSFCPELIKYEELKPDSSAENLDLAFSLAEKLGIPRLIEPADMLVESGPNKFFVITYLAQFVDHFRHEETIAEPAPLGFCKQYEVQSTSRLQEAEHKKRLRSGITRSNTTRSFDRVHLVKGGTVAGTVKELKRIASPARSPRVEMKRPGTITERLSLFNRKTGSQTKTSHVAGDPFISERVPTGLVAERIALFLKIHQERQLDIEFIMVTSPKVRRARRRDGQAQSPAGQSMSNIYYVMRGSASSPSINADMRSLTVEPLVL